MPWIWRAAKKYAKKVYRTQKSVGRSYYSGYKKYSRFNDWKIGLQARPARYAHIAYTNRGGRYPAPRFGLAWKGRRTPYQGSRAQKDADYWHRKYTQMMRRVYNEPGSGARRPRNRFRMRN